MFFERGGDVAFGIGERLFANPIGGHFRNMGFGHLKKVPKNIVVPHFQVGDARFFPLGFFKLGNPAPTSFSKIYEGFGGYGILVERPEDIRDALQKAFDSGKPAVVDIITEPTAMSRMGGL